MGGARSDTTLSRSTSTGSMSSETASPREQRCPGMCSPAASGASLMRGRDSEADSGSESGFEAGESGNEKGSESGFEAGEQLAATLAASPRVSASPSGRSADGSDWSFMEASKGAGPAPNIGVKASRLPSIVDLLPHRFADPAVELAYQIHFDRMKVRLGL